MRFGIREICNVVFRAKTKQKLGSRTFYKNEPVLYFDTLKTSNMEGAATTVYAQGGRGNPRLIAWEGERTLTFTMEDALLSPEGLSILTGAGLIAAADANSGQGMFVHTTDTIEVLEDNTIILPKDFACWTGDAVAAPNDNENLVVDDDTVKENQHPSADIFIMVMDESGNIIAEPCIPAKVEYKKELDINGKEVKKTIVTCYGHEGNIPVHTVVFVDYYVRRISKATQVEITADKFGGAYYIEADTLFRREGDNYDMPATFVIPNGKVQSNFTFAMAATGDPSTFTFTVDAMPDYTKFDRTHKILAGILIIEDEDEEDEDVREVCVKTFKQAATSKTAGVTAKIETDSDTECTIKVSGTNVAQDQLKKEPDMWGPNPPSKAAVVEVNMPVDEAGEYTLVTTNPALKNYYPGDSRIEHDTDTDKYIKTQSLTLDEDDELELQVLIDDSNEDITIEFSKEGALVKTYTIKSNLTFKA